MIGTEVAELMALRRLAFELAMAVLQSDLYSQSLEARNATDDIIAICKPKAKEQP